MTVAPVRAAVIAASLAALSALVACGNGDDEAMETARDLCHQRVADQAWVSEVVEFVSTESLDPVEDTYFFHGLVDFPTASGVTERHGYNCKVTPNRGGPIWNETEVNPA